MSISVFNLFKLGIGPSSSHTVGPMLAAHRFLSSVRAQHALADVGAIEIDLYGSLSATGKGHGTDGAVVAGLMGFLPETVDPECIRPNVERCVAEGAFTAG